MQPIVSVNIMGGLGNQLFQIAAAYSYAKKHCVSFAILNRKDNGNRSFYWNTILLCMKTYVAESLPSLPQWNEDVATMYKELPTIMDQHGLMINGYLQSSKYHIPEIKQLFKASLSKELSEKYPILLSNKDHIVIMHSRQTDYHKHPDFHGPLDITYYVRALAKMTYDVPHPFIVLCGDDNQFWNQMKLPFPHMILEESDINTFALLQQFKHFIMSNSTFIWWCVYLADAKNVIVPAKWFGPAGPQLYEDIYEPNWVRM
jgi:hypothetical protein